jgi:hypothetical protein
VKREQDVSNIAPLKNKNGSVLFRDKVSCEVESGRLAQRTEECKDISSCRRIHREMNGEPSLQSGGGDDVEVVEP